MLTLIRWRDKMWLLSHLLLILVAVCCVERTHGENHEQNCSYDPMEELLMCTMRTLEPSKGTANNSIHKNHHWSHNLHTSAKNLIIQCTGDEHYQESVLRKNHFGYLPNLRTLQLVNCKIRTIPALAFTGLSGLVELNVETRNSEWSSMVMEVEKDAFRGLNDLRKLNLTKNNLWTLPPSAFCGLASLTTLNLSTNYLQDVSDLGFAASNQIACRIPLRIVDLSSNSFSKLSHEAFGQLKKLEYLNLEGNNLNVVDDDALGGLTTLRILKLSDNHLVALPPELLKQSEYIQELFLQNNSLSALAPRIFKELKHLLVLNLSRNEISDDLLSPETFSSLVRLMALDLSHNRIQEIKQNVLTGLTSLQLLDLSHNQLKSIHRRTFLSLRNLHTLKLSHNSIDRLHSQSFAGLRVLSSLSLERNKLKKINEEVLVNCTSLTTLVLSGNLFNQVPRGLRILSKLKTIDLSFNLINKLDNSSFSGLNSELYGISLAGNGISEFNSSVFIPIPKIEVLNLANNEINKLNQGVFNEVPKLRMLRLDHNRLKDINGILVGLADLQWLNVSSNQLRWFDYAFFPKKLEWLDLHDNQIEDLGNYYKLGEGFSLKTLDVRSNHIKRIESLSLIQSLHTVLLSNNHISKIKAGAFNGKTQLVKADLSNNRIRDLTLSALSVETSNTASMKGQNFQTPEFYLAGNPLFCDCEMEWLQKINSMNQNRQYARIVDIDEVTCTLNNQPGLGPSVLVKNIQSTDFVCQYQAHCFALCMCCDFFACDCRMQCPEGCSCFHDSTWSSNIIQCSLRGHQDVPPLIPMDATSIRLDGNNFTGILESQAFIGRKRVQSLYLNNSQIAAINNQTFNGLTELLILHLQDNLMQRLEGHEFGNLTSLKELHLERNQLVYITENTFSSLVSLEVLYLNDNLLAAYPAWTLSQALPSLNTLQLSGNPWSCECTFVHKLQVFARKDGVVMDLEQIECRGDGVRPLVETVYHGENITCSDAMAITLHPTKPFKIDVIPIALASIAFCVIIAVSSIIMFVFRTPLKVWLHSKYGVRVLSSDGKSARDKLYDAFVSYSVKDEDFVNQILIPQLEHQEMASFKLCLQYRDLPKTSSIAEAFPGVSQLCAKHILVVTRAYLESEWSQIKFAVKDFKKWRPVIILLEDLSNLDLAAVPEFNLLLKTGPTIGWRDPGFWNKLRYYLPDARYMSYKHRNLHGNIMSLNGSTAGGGNTGLNPNQKDTSDITSSVGTYLQHAQITTNKSNNNQLTNNISGIGSSSNWQYEDSSSSALHLLNSSNSNNSSQASTRSTIAGSSPRTVVNNTSSNGSSNSSGNINPMNNQHFNSDMVQVVSNPLDALTDPAYRVLMHQSPPPPAPTTAVSAISNALNQHQHEHIYHTLDPEDTFKPKSNYGGNYDTLGKLEVMLPNGKMVPATLVRNVTGRIVPLVDMSSPERRMDNFHDVMSNSPIQSQPQLTLQQKYCLDNIDNTGIVQRISPVHAQPQMISRNQSVLANMVGKETASPLRNSPNVDFHNSRRQQNSNRQFL